MKKRHQPKSDLTIEQFNMVRELYASGKWSHNRLAKKFGVSERQIRKAVKGIVKPKPTVLQRFDAKWTEDENGCHIWNGYKTELGYGQFRMKGKVHLANRAAFGLKKRPLEPYEVVRHKCDNPSCVNPEHLEVGSIQDNNKDKMDRFRQPWQYSANTYLEMRFLIQIEVSVDAIVERFGIKKETLKKRLKDMDKTTDDPTEDKVFYYRNRAIHEERERQSSPS